MLRIKKIQLKRIRAFKDLVVNFVDEDDSECRLQTVLIGKNGTCKTTFLRAIAIGLADSKDASGLLAEPTGTLVAEGEEDAHIQITLSDDTVLETRIGLDDGQDVLLSKSPENEELDKLLVVGYGIGRLNEGPDQFRTYRLVDSVYSLFQYESTLISTELALRRLQDFLASDKYPQTMRQMKAALGLHEDVILNVEKGGGVTVSGTGVGAAIPIEGWADGYRKTLNWILDFYSWAMRAKAVDEAGLIQGILLIDELEQHLFPALQSTLLPKLRELFPNVQIIATTHSPMIALGAKNAEDLVVFKRENGQVTQKQSGRELSGYSVEDILVDPDIFGSTAYGPETSEQLHKYQELIRKPVEARTGTETESLRTISSELMKQQLPEVKNSEELKMLNDLLKKHKLDK